MEWSDWMLRSEVVFRGQPDKNFALLPSIGRNRRDFTDFSILDKEKELIETAQHKLPHIFKPDLDSVDLLALLQHHGIPTRLLDVTLNPLVALYFSALNSGGEDEDGEVIVFRTDSIAKTDPYLNRAIANTCKIADTGRISPELFYDIAVDRKYLVDLREEPYGRTDEEIKEYIYEYCHKLILVKSSELSERQKMQQGLYFLFPNDMYEDTNDGQLFWRMMAPIDKEGESVERRIIVKKEGKAKILEHLGYLGVSEERLFPDNIDIVCRNILRFYDFYK